MELPRLLCCVSDCRSTDLGSQLPGRAAVGSKPSNSVQPQGCRGTMPDARWKNLYSGRTGCCNCNPRNNKSYEDDEQCSYRLLACHIPADSVFQNGRAILYWPHTIFVVDMSDSLTKASRIIAFILGLKITQIFF